MLRLIVQHAVLKPNNAQMLNWLGETEDSWIRFFLDTYVSYDTNDNQVLYDYFDAVFSETDWEWRNGCQAPMEDIVSVVLQEYTLFRTRVDPVLAFIHNPPMGYRSDLTVIERRGLDWVLNITLDEVSP